MTSPFEKYPFPSWIFASWDELCARSSRQLCSPLVRAFLKFHGCGVGSRFAADGIPLIRMQQPGSVTIGSGVTINTRQRSNMAGIMQRSTIQCIGEGKVLLEDGSGISGAVLSARTSIRIGQRTNLGVNTRVYDHDFHSLNPEHRTDRRIDASNVRSTPVEIGKDVLVGANVVILKGVRIGDRSVIGAGSVVGGGEYQGGSVIAGNPARVIREFS